MKKGRRRTRHVVFIFSPFLPASLVAQMVKPLPAMWETWVQSVGREDPLEKEMATHSGTLAWKIPWTEEPGRLQSMGLQTVRHAWVTPLSLFPVIKRKMAEKSRLTSGLIFQWMFTGRTDAGAEAPILWPLDGKNWLFRKDSNAGKDWGQEEKGTKGDEMVGWHHQLDGHEFGLTPGVGDG